MISVANTECQVYYYIAVVGYVMSVYGTGTVCVGVCVQTAYMQ